jgi:hypothetical protein
MQETQNQQCNSENYANTSIHSSNIVQHFFFPFAR